MCGWQVTLFLFENERLCEKFRNRNPNKRSNWNQLWNPPIFPYLYQPELGFPIHYCLKIVLPKFNLEKTIFFFLFFFPPPFATPPPLLPFFPSYLPSFLFEFLSSLSQIKKNTMSDPASTGNTAFVAAAEKVHSLTTKPSNDSLLKLYSLFKQGIVGDNETGKFHWFIYFDSFSLN